MMTISEQAATGSADREAVAIALGWVKEDAPGDAADWFFWRLPDGKMILGNPTDYQRDLAATLAEYERHNLGYILTSGRPGFYVAAAHHGKPPAGYERVISTTSIENAAIAALLKALENSDGN